MTGELQKEEHLHQQLASVAEANKIWTLWRSWYDLDLPGNTLRSELNKIISNSKQGFSVNGRKPPLYQSW